MRLHRPELHQFMPLQPRQLIKNAPCKRRALLVSRSAQILFTSSCRPCRGLRWFESGQRMAGERHPVLVEKEHLAHGIPQLRDVQEPISTYVVPCRRHVSFSNQSSGVARAGSARCKLKASLTFFSLTGPGRAETCRMPIACPSNAGGGL